MDKKALLIIDIQNDYFAGGAMPLTNTESAANNASLLLQSFRNRELPVVYIQHIATRPNAAFFRPGNGSEIHASVKPQKDEKVIVKHYPNSFYETDLLEYLKSNQISELVVCGMMTHMCVDATVRAAKDLGFKITLVSDACATKQLEINEIRVSANEVQTSFLAALSYYYAEIKTTRELF